MSEEVAMKRNLTILFQVIFICALFTNAWALTNYERCVKYFEDKDYKNAYQVCKEEKDYNAQYIIGEMYYNGLGVKEDHAEAMLWFRKAAEQGNGQAQFFVGYMYYNGLGVKKDHAEAMLWFRKAAKNGHIRARIYRDMMLNQDHSK
ncbi:MAG TPA: tetratricopeptide repeat protein [Smithellaceae bacterium]|nr:tetratricopeptide repeat protein [Smithellaceae bacterium]